MSEKEDAIREKIEDDIESDRIYVFDLINMSEEEFIKKYDIDNETYEEERRKL